VVRCSGVGTGCDDSIAVRVCGDGDGQGGGGDALVCAGEHLHRLAVVQPLQTVVVWNIVGFLAVSFVHDITQLIENVHGGVFLRYVQDMLHPRFQAAAKILKVFYFFLNFITGSTTRYHLLDICLNEAEGMLEAVDTL